MCDNQEIIECPACKWQYSAALKGCPMCEVVLGNQKDQKD